MFFFLKLERKLKQTHDKVPEQNTTLIPMSNQKSLTLARSRVIESSIFPMLFKRLVTGSNVTYHQHKPSLQFSSLFLSSLVGNNKILQIF
jgi:hypothetical protein